MPSMNDLSTLVNELHQKKIINADTSVRDMLAINAGHITSRGQEAGWYAIGGEHYVIVCGMTDISGKVTNPVARGGVRPGG